ncbi:TIGR03943 family putative permease subunit [Nocardioides sp. LML1-1-1.1]|uniref:TIGR03943 family putative permease subunit n=1 Tax=Nocardioides sp. LML1-1-1.1 TaxID=3135248 RepID=UPI00341CEC0A
MNRNAQAVVLAALGALTLRVSVTDEHTRYVNAAMKWPLVVSGVLMLLLALSRVLRREDGGEPTTPAVWVLLLPVVVGLAVQPAALGAYVADRRVNDVSAQQYDEPAVDPLPRDRTTDVGLAEFVSLAAGYGEALAGREVRLVGFVTHADGAWFVNRLTISCCAADASAFRVRIDAGDVRVDVPAEKTWVRVVGRWAEGTGVEGVDLPALRASAVEEVPAPRQPYE